MSRQHQDWPVTKSRLTTNTLGGIGTGGARPVVGARMPGAQLPNVRSTNLNPSRQTLASTKLASRHSVNNGTNRTSPYAQSMMNKGPRNTSTSKLSGSNKTPPRGRTVSNSNSGTPNSQKSNHREGSSDARLGRNRSVTGLQGATSMSGAASLGAKRPVAQGAPVLMRRSLSRSAAQDAKEAAAVAEQRLPQIANGGGLPHSLSKMSLGASAPNSGRSHRSAERGSHVELRATPPTKARMVSPIRTNSGRIGSRSEERGLVGLTNLGNTCFMNSCLQCLLNTEGLVEWFLSNQWESEIQRKSPMKGQIAQAFADLTRQIHNSKSKSSVSPAALKRVVGKWAPHFSGFSQQDSQEFMRFLLDGLNEDLRRERRKPNFPERKEGEPELDPQTFSEISWEKHLYMNDSYITEMFCGQLMSQIKCLSCNYVSHCFDPFLDLSVPIPKQNQIKERIQRSSKAGTTYPPPQTTARCTLEACLTAFSKEEILDGDDKYSCERCKKRRKGLKQLRVHRFPPYIVIHIKRFQYSQYSRDKLGTSVEFPFSNLDLTRIASPNLKTYNNLPPIYDLYAISNHMGGLGGGHYTAHCANRMSNNWYTFNDSLVTAVSPESISGSNAYVLFYKQQGLRGHI